ncbi:MAG: cytochrome c oxidase assembly protein, partial [Pseudomonas sp.]|nr:cytochrome c oxidase assembly protein [Pseudomonas sp.]
PLWALARPLPQWHGITGRFAQPLWTVILRAGRYPTLLALLHGAVIWIWHTPKLYVLALDNLWWHAFEHACFLFSGWLFWWSVLRANPKQVPQALMAVVLTLMHTGLLGALLTFGTTSFYGAGRSVEDQQLAGLLMWVPGGLIYLLGGGWIVWRWLTRIWRRQPAHRLDQSS